MWKHYTSYLLTYHFSQLSNTFQPNRKPLTTTLYYPVMRILPLPTQAQAASQIIREMSIIFWMDSEHGDMCVRVYVCVCMYIKWMSVDLATLTPCLFSWVLPFPWNLTSNNPRHYHLHVWPVNPLTLLPHVEYKLSVLHLVKLGQHKLLRINFTERQRCKANTVAHKSAVSESGLG